MKSVRTFRWLLALAILPLFAVSPQACEFCSGEKGETLVMQFADAQMVLYGHFENARIDKSDIGQGESDLIFEDVLKSHDAIKGMKKLTVPKYIANPKLKFVVFCEVYNGKINAFKGTLVSDGSEMRKYVDAILKNKDKSQSERLRVAFDFLNSPEVEVAMDAYREYSRADYKDYKEIAKTLPADKIAGWMQDPKTPQFRYGLYASLLGHCGNAKHAEMLFTMINDPEKQKLSGLHGMMASYVMLEPKKGWKFLSDVVQDKEQPFMLRYSALQTMRFLWDNRLDLLGKDENAARAEVVKSVAAILPVNDMTDFAVEDLRKWRRWECCDRVLDLFGKDGFSRPIVRKSILRYALQCPSPRAAEFVKAQKALHPDWVDETLDLLNLESTPAPVTSQPKDSKAPTPTPNAKKK